MNYFDIINRLSGDGLDVALPGYRNGVCSSPYVVVQKSGTYRYAQSPALGYTLFTVHCYVPLYSYEQLDTLIRRVKSALKALEPDLRPVGNEGIFTINDSFKAHEGYLEFMLQKRLF